MQTEEQRQCNIQISMLQRRLRHLYASVNFDIDSYKVPQNPLQAVIPDYDEKEMIKRTKRNYEIAKLKNQEEIEKIEAEIEALKNKMEADD